MFNPTDRVVLVSLHDPASSASTKGTVLSRSRICLDPRNSYTEYAVKWDNGTTSDVRCPPAMLVAESNEQTYREILYDVFRWGLSHKLSCPHRPSNFQAGQPCKCGRDALLERVRKAIGKNEKRADER